MNLFGIGKPRKQRKRRLQRKGNTQKRDVDYSNLLKGFQLLGGFKSQSEFAKACGQAPSNISSYIKNTKPLSFDLLQKIARQLFEWPIKDYEEMKPISRIPRKLQRKSGLYVLYDSAGKVLYVGKATTFQAEVQQTLSREIPGGIRLSPDLKRRECQFKEITRYISLYCIESEQFLEKFEALILRILANQTFNMNIGHF